MSDTTRKEGQYWVLPKKTNKWAVWYYAEKIQRWLDPARGNEHVSAELITIDEKRLERTVMGADYYRPVFAEISSWIATKKDDPRKVQVALSDNGLRVVIYVGSKTDTTKKHSMFVGTVQTLEELQTIWRCIPAAEFD